VVRRMLREGWSRAMGLVLSWSVRIADIISIVS
jgi:hypothetical protein